MEYITTYTGKRFFPIAPESDKIDITDIAHSLSMHCRGNGHVTTFFSVAQHCILCAKEALARGYSDRIALACLLHDAAESYLSDVPRPLKKEIPSYNEYESAILDLVYEKYLGSILTDSEKELVRVIDDDMLYFDLAVLLKETPDSPRPDVHIEPDYTFVPFSEVEDEYLQLFENISKKLNYAVDKC